MGFLLDESFPFFLLAWFLPLFCVYNTILPCLSMYLLSKLPVALCHLSSMKLNSSQNSWLYVFPSSFFGWSFGDLGSSQWTYFSSALVCFSLGAFSIGPIRLEATQVAANGMLMVRGVASWRRWWRDLKHVCRPHCDCHRGLSRKWGRLCTPVAVSTCFSSLPSVSRLFIQLCGSLLHSR